MFTDIKGFWKSGALIFCSTVVSDDEWLHEAGTLLLDLSVLFMWDALSLKNLGNLLSSGEINLTDLISLTLSEISFVVHISSLLCSCSFLWEIRLEDLKGTIAGNGKISCLSNVETTVCSHYVSRYLRPLSTSFTADFELLKL